MAHGLTIEWHNEIETTSLKYTVMNSPKVNTQNNSRQKVKNLSTVIAMLLAMVTLFQASADSKVKVERKITKLEAETLSEIDAYFADDIEMELEDVILLELEMESSEEVKVFDSEGNLVAEGNPTGNDELRSLINQADYLSSFANKKYYRIAE